MLIRALLRVAQSRHLSPARLCLGLGFDPDDLRDPVLRVSYRQTRALCKRLQVQLNEPSLGLLAGQAQTPLSWGLPGLVMLTCQTLGEAIAFCAVHQDEAGALVSLHLERQDGLFLIEVEPRYHDPELEPLLIDEAFASMLTVVRALVGADFMPERVELALPAPAHAHVHRRVFGCDVQYNMPSHRMWTSQRWLARELAGWDPYACDALRGNLASLLKGPEIRNDFHESALTWLRGNLGSAPSMTGLARHLNLGERTLRRRLDALGVSWRGLHDQVRRDHALALLQRAGLPIHEVASATGFDDPRAFRRAFKRWTGTRPSALRQR
ncbi:AraC family transcriptional regulator [Variovorax ginsengisoli]|uniref:AraC-like DNA-binding protein n=1 Tax=Variovorax ginsengisoli TaxID=363844 RepID=A0ABT9S921_9BURK|nr:AraC family transcriptional regulator [Variovorax ginsengisoli]MDP9900849.1 AraC-like DNA-binding protein [Variovorax ginsengisoli]